MRRDLTRRYLLPSEKKGGKNPFLFLRDVYRYGKSREFASFMVWELFHRMRLFPKERYLVFNNGEALTLDNKRLNDSDFREKMNRFFSSQELGIISSRHNWKLLFINNSGESFGCLYPDDRDLYKSVDDGESAVFVNRFPERIKSLFVSSQNTVFVCVEGAVYRGADGGSSFNKTLDLSTSESFFRHNNAMTETPDKTLVIGEYGNVWDKRGWRTLAYLYFSSDNGQTWEKSDFLIKEGINKHVHLVKYSRLLNKVLVADGDNKKKLWVSGPLDTFDAQTPGWKPVNRFHIQMGGYTSIAEDDGRIFLGTDYQGGTNFIVESRDGERFEKKIVPDPYRRSPIDNMVARRSRKGNEIWANLPYSTSGTRCLLMYTANGGESWNKVIEYDRATHVVWLLSSSNEITDGFYFSIQDYKNHDRLVYKVVDYS